MKAIIITASVFLVMFIGTLGYIIGLSQGLPTEKNNSKYYGFDDVQIPDSIVRLLVESKFAYTSPAEDSVLSNWFTVKNERFKYMGYESDDTNYTNGQILLPDLVHSDTLIVTNAPYLNECLARPDVGSDGDIMEILNETTVRYSLLPNTITMQETDSRGLVTVQYIQDGQEFELDHMNRVQYDSAFHDYVNYKKIEDNR